MVRMSRRKTHKLHSGAIVLLLFVLVIAVYGFISYRSPLPALAAQPVSQNPAESSNVALPWPKYGGAAIGAVGYGLLASHNADKPVPTASTAKTMTALMVLKKYPLAVGAQGPTITLTQKDVDYYDTYFAEDGSLVKVAAGEKITEYQALEAMMLPSANNMAESLAVWAYGSQANYLIYANNYAKQLGMDNSHFTDASGFAPATKASPNDMVKLGIAAIQNPVLAKVVDEKSAVVPVAGRVNNVNWLLGSHGINGIKTGSTDQDGGALLFSAPKTYSNGQTITIVGVIMGAKYLQQAMDDSVPLLTAAEQGFKPTTVVTAGQVVGRYDVPWDISIDATAQKSLTLLAWQGQTIKPEVTLRPLQVPSAKGAQVGVITTAADPAQKIPVILSQATTAPDWYWRATRHL